MRARVCTCTFQTHSAPPSFPIMKGDIVENSGKQGMERKPEALDFEPFSLMLQLTNSHTSVSYSCLSVRLPLPLLWLSKLPAFFRTQPTQPAVRSHNIPPPSLLGW